MKNSHRFISILTCLALFMSLISSYAFADNDSSDNKVSSVSEAAEYLIDNKSDNYIKRDPVNSVTSKYPSTFDLRDRGVVTPVKNQSPFGTCWGFSAIAASETSILSEMGKTYDETKLDLSEHHLAYFARQPLSDGSSQDGEGIHVIDGFDQIGGASVITATSMFSSGIGVVYEDLFPYRGKESKTDSLIIFNYQYSKDDDWTIPAEYEFYQSLELEESYLLRSPAIFSDDTDINDFLSRDKGYIGYDATATEDIKSEIYAGRAVSIAFCADTYLPGDVSSGLIPQYINTSGKNWAHFTYDGGVPNHAVTVVGWDDNFPASEFLDHSDDKYGDGTAHLPEGNGAWICKNSWGASTEDFPNNVSWGNIDDDGNYTGYFYISYYDRSLCDIETFDYDISESNSYIIDQYDYMQTCEKTGWLNSVPIQMANVFTAEYDETIRALSCETNFENCEVLYQVYLLDSDTSLPDEGNLVAEADAEYTFSGFHRIDLSQPVDVKKGQKYAVVVTQKIQVDGRDLFEISCDRAENEEYVLKYNLDLHRENPNADDDSLDLYPYYTKGIVNEGESYLYIEDLGSWFDFSKIISELHSYDDYKKYDFDNFSIKAYSNFKNEKDIEDLVEDMPEGVTYADPAGEIDSSSVILYVFIVLILIAVLVLLIVSTVKKIKKRKYYKRLEKENAELRSRLSELAGDRFDRNLLE